MKDVTVSLAFLDDIDAEGRENAIAGLKEIGEGDALLGVQKSIEQVIINIINQRRQQRISKQTAAINDACEKHRKKVG